MKSNPGLHVGENESLSKDAIDWRMLCINLRQSLNLTQKQMAARLGINQASLSRWERGLTAPQYESRELILALAQGQGLGTSDDLENIVRISPFPMLLLDHNNRVVAASQPSGYTPGLPVIEQTPPEQHAKAEAFLEQLNAEGFWEQRCASREYWADIGGEMRRAVVSPVMLRGEVYALVQKDW